MIFASRGYPGRILLLTDAEHSIPPDRRYEVQRISGWYDPSPFDQFSKHTAMNRETRAGFWFFALERFFVLQQFMAKNSLEKLFHAELDVLIFNLRGVAETCDRVRGIFAVQDSPDRALASIFYVNDSGVFDHFLEFVGRQNSARNEMAMLGSYLNQFPEKAHSFPSSASLNPSPPGTNWGYELAQFGLFDAAAFGQWLFGVDPRLVKQKVLNHFRSETVEFPIEDVRYSYYPRIGRLVVRQPDALPVELRNLHIHSKIIRRLVFPGVLRFYLLIAGLKRRSVVTHRPGWLSHKLLSSLLGPRWPITKRLHKFAGFRVTTFLSRLSAQSTVPLSNRQAERLESLRRGALL